MNATTHHFLVTMIPPAALLLSHCAPFDGIQPSTDGVMIGSEPFRQQIAFRPGAFPLSGTLFAGALTVCSEGELRFITPGDVVFSEPEIIALPPLVVTETRIFPDLSARWPANVIEAELQAEWIAREPREPSLPHVTDESVFEWIESLR